MNGKLFRFLKATGRLGIGSVTLSCVLFAISIYEHALAHNVPAYWLVLLACVFFAFGSYAAWHQSDNELARERANNVRPLLKIELLRAFFDVERRGAELTLRTYIYAYIRVTNLSTTETVLSSATLVMGVEGTRYKAQGDDSQKVGNALEHRSDFHIGGEARTEVFQDIVSPFPRLMTRVNYEHPLRRGIPMLECPA